MARSQLLLAVGMLPWARAASPRSSLVSAILVHSRHQELSSEKSMRLAVAKHSATVEPPSWAAERSLMNSIDRSSRSGQNTDCPRSTVNPIRWIFKTSPYQLTLSINETALRTAARAWLPVEWPGSLSSAVVVRLRGSGSREFG